MVGNRVVSGWKSVVGKGKIYRAIPAKGRQVQGHLQKYISVELNEVATTDRVIS